MNEENTQVNTEVVETSSTEAPSTPAAPQPGTAEYNATLAAEGAAALGNVPDKFKNEDGSVNTEALAKSYMELENKMHSQPSEPTPEPEPVTDSGPDAVVEELRVPEVPEGAAEVEEQAAQVGLTKTDLSDMTQEIMRSGSISEEQRASLNERGIDNAVIEVVVEGQRARMRQQYSQAADIVGGSDRLSKIFGWAAHNLDDVQRAQINAGLASNASEITLRGLASMYDVAAANTPRSQEPQEGNRKPGQSPAGREVVQGFASKQEYYKASEELQKDPNNLRLRQSIEERMVKTDWSTIG